MVNTVHGYTNATVEIPLPGNSNLSANINQEFSKVVQSIFGNQKVYVIR